MRSLVPLATLASALALASAPPPARAVERGVTYVPANVSLFPPVELFPFRHKTVVGASVNLLWGRSRSVYGLEVGGILNRELQDFGGLQFAGIANWVSRDATGLQVAGLVNSARRCRVVQLSVGFNNCATGSAFQVGLANAASKRASAFQAGLVNFGEAMPFGLQIGLANNVLVDFTGVQIGLINLDGSTFPTTVGSCGYNCEIKQTTIYPNSRTRGLFLGAGNTAQNLRGAQIGFVNASARTFHGAQIAPIVNVAGDGGGFQLGAFNIARNVRGVQVGLVNFARRLRGLQIGALNIAYKNALPVMIGINGGF